ncbi:TRAP transporter permease [Noviherbaspirillum sp.]|uniref:TRAP transporter permease n=1 Tax=Noviherbaspirillum sp. TaxID=1926288 RepID=UPI002FE2EAC5
MAELLHPEPGQAIPAADEFQEHGIQRKLGGYALKILIAAALTFSTYQLIVAAFHPLSSLVIRSLHVGFLLMITFLLYPAVKRSDLSRVAWYDWLLAGGAFVLSTYHWIFEGDLILRAGDPSTTDLVVGTIMVVMVFEAARRIMGMALPVICAAFLLYGLFGEYLPGSLAHRGFGFDQIVDQLFIGTEGIFGIPTMVSATYIFLFILFGAFLEHAGMIKLFNSVALGLVGHAQGGPAKVAVVSSGMMGTISGSGVANVLTVGQFTIPLMKRFGYSGVFAGAVEATASMGGQIMPPVMGAVAFIMAETLNVPYSEIVKAAIIPALLYYFTVFVMVHLEAGRLKLMGLPKDQCPSAWKAIKADWHLVLPLAALVFMLFHGFTPMFAGLTGLALTAILILGAAVSARISMQAFRYVFWVATGLAAATFLEFGIYPILGVIGFLCLCCFFIQGGHKTLQTMKSSLVDGAKQGLVVGVACAVVGVIIGVLTLTGAASSFAGFILTVGEKSLFISLVLTMLVCLVLGMGIPTIPNYIITSAIAAPALLQLDVPLIVSHMFVFYFGIMADLTPPVALAAFAAASISKDDPDKTGWKATQLAIAGYVVPFMAVYTPALMLQGDWTALGVVYVVFKALLAITLWSAAAVGFFWTPLKLIERIFVTVAAALLVVALPITDELGLGMSAAFFAWHFWQKRRLALA